MVQKLLSSTRAVAVPKSEVPKFRPVIVTLVPPLFLGALRGAADVMIGPSYENCWGRVPTIPLTVTRRPFAPQLVDAIEAAGAAHRRLVSVLHDVVSQGGAPC